MGVFKGTVSWERIPRRTSADFLRTFLTSCNKWHFPQVKTYWRNIFFVISAQLFAALRIRKPSFGKVPEFDLMAQSLSCQCATENLISLSTQLFSSDSWVWNCGVLSLRKTTASIWKGMIGNRAVCMEKPQFRIFRKSKGQNGDRLRNMWIKLRINRHLYVVCFTEQVTLSNLPWK
jgi:hypothetical protein